MLEAFDAADNERNKEVVAARQYHEGIQGVQLTDRLKEFLDLKSLSAGFRMNVCRNVVTALTERLMVSGFDCEDSTSLDWYDRIWKESKLDAIQEEVHEIALRDGEAFVIVDYEDDGPVFVPHYRFIPTDTDGGDGYGCRVFYEQDDPNQPAQLALKQWLERDFDEFFERRNLYYPNRIEKYTRGAGTADWTLMSTEPWVDAVGDPLGIAVVHFKNKDLRPEALDAISMQDAINKSLIDLLTAADITAFRIFVALGFIPTIDGKAPADDRSNWWVLTPGEVVGTTKAPGDASFTAIEPSDLSSLQELTHQLVLWMAMVSNTPVTRFVSTKLIASDETLKEQEGPLLARVQGCQTRFGDSWAECLTMAARLHNSFSDADVQVDLEAALQPIWTEPMSRSQSERLDLLLKKQSLGIPQEQLWREAGYSQSQIEQMRLYIEEASPVEQEQDQEVTEEVNDDEEEQ